MYGPLANGTTTVMFESTPTYPDAGRYWEVVARLGITIFYTAPTALRVLAAAGDSHVTAHDRSSLRVLGTVGEPIDPTTWRWYHQVVGDGRCNVVDTWWQTETGGVMISPLAAVTAPKPGRAMDPVPGVLPELVDERGLPIVGPGAGRLCIRHPWPGVARTVWGDHERYVKTYFSEVPGRYFTGDGAERDSDGHYRITGRVDDVLNVSGHRMGTAEIEAALNKHEGVAEVAIVGVPHAVKGEGVFGWIVPQPGVRAGPELVDELQHALRIHIGAHARLDGHRFVDALPKTRSGKCVRRLLRKIAAGDTEALGDLSTLADPSVVDDLLRG